MEKRLLLALSLCLLSAQVFGQTRYQVVERDGVKWFADSAGHTFFSLGVCVVDEGTKFDDYDVKNPAYGAWRFYSDKPAWAADACKTLADGGFNTIGAWSEYAALLKVPGNDLKFTPIIHSGSSAGFPWTDMWDPKLVKVADDVTRDLVRSLGRDRRIIGYFSDNELGWWRPALFNWVWKQKTTFTRQRVVALLEHRYKTWARLRKDFVVKGADTWSNLRSTGELFLNPRGNGQPAISEVLSLLANRYYSVCRHAIKKYDPGALYLGDRYISNYYPEVATQAGKFCDVVSTNLNPNWNDGQFVRYHLDGLRKLTGKPLMITEFYMSARQNRSGNQNDRSGFPVVDTLSERAKGAARTLLDLLREPDVVGAHWFQYYDEPKNGRGDGENYNFGLVDVDNRPYTELLDSFKTIDLDHRRKRSIESSRTLIIDGISYRFIPSASAIPRGDLYLHTDADGTRIKLLWSEERFSEDYFEGGKVPSAWLPTIELRDGQDRLLWKRVIDPSHSVDPADPLHSAAKIDAASTLDVKIPRSILSRGPFHITLTSQSRAYKTVWQFDL